MSSNIRELLVEEVEDRGFTIPRRAELDDLPPDVTVLSSSEIVQHMTQYSAMISYAATEEAIAKAEAEAAKGRHREVRAQMWISARAEADKKQTISDLEAKLEADPDLVEIQQDRIVAENYAHMVAALLKGYEQSYQLLSREITRRGLTNEGRLD